MPDIQKAEIDDEGTVFLEIDGQPIAFQSPDWVRAPGFGDQPFRFGRPKRPNPTKWPPVVTYVIGPGEEGGGLVRFDLRELMTVQVEDVESVVRSLCALPWAVERRPELWLTIADAATQVEVMQGLQAQMGPDMPQVHLVGRLTPDAGTATDHESDA